MNIKRIGLILLLNLGIVFNSLAQQISLDVKCSTASTDKITWKYSNDTAVISLSLAHLNLKFIQNQYSINISKGEMTFHNGLYMGQVKYDNTIKPKRYIYSKSNFPEVLKPSVYNNHFSIEKLPFTSPFLVLDTENRDTVALYNYKGGIKHGYCTDLRFAKKHYEVNQLKSQIQHYQFGRLHGLNVYYHKDSSIVFKQYNNGIWLNSKKFHKNGVLVFHEIDDVFERHYYLSGKLKSSIDTTHFEDKTRLGHYYTYTKYHPNGVLATKGFSYNQDITMEFGTWYYYDLSGKIIKKKDYGNADFAPKVNTEVLEMFEVRKEYSLPSTFKTNKEIVSSLKNEFKWRKRHYGSMIYKVALDKTGQVISVENLSSSKRLRKKATLVQEYFSNIKYKPGQFAGSSSDGTLIISLDIEKQ